MGTTTAATNPMARINSGQRSISFDSRRECHCMVSVPSNDELERPAADSECALCAHNDPGVHSAPPQLSRPLQALEGHGSKESKVARNSLRLRISKLKVLSDPLERVNSIRTDFPYHRSIRVQLRILW
jgi:hypothetical protein